MTWRMLWKRFRWLFQSAPLVCDKCGDPYRPGSGLFGAAHAYLEHHIEDHIKAQREKAWF
jgi:hypothetical protein